MVAVFTTLESLRNEALKNQEEELVLGSNPRIKFHIFLHVFDYLIYLQSCPVVAIITKAQFLNPFSTKFIVLDLLGLSLFT